MTYLKPIKVGYTSYETFIDDDTMQQAEALLAEFLTVFYKHRKEACTMATLQITKQLHIPPLIDIQSTTFAERYVSGVHWRLFGWHVHGEIAVQGPLPEHYLIDNLKLCARLNRFDGDHDEPLRADSGFFLGMLHGGVLTPDRTLRPDAKTLVIIHTHDFREGYARGRHDYFTQDEGIVHTEDNLLDVLKAHAKDNLYLGREQSILRWAVGCTVGELSGRLFPLTQQEQP